MQVTLVLDNSEAVQVASADREDVSSLEKAGVGDSGAGFVVVVGLLHEFVVHVDFVIV